MAMIRRVTQWYTQQPRTEKIIYAAVALLILVILTNLALTGYVWVESAKEGLSIHLELDEQRLEIGHEQTTPVTFTLGVSNAPFCTAKCTYTITDHQTKEVVGRGEETFSTHAIREVTHEYTAPSTGRYHAPLQIRASCTNRAASLCQRANDTSIAATSATINLDFNQQEKELYEELQARLATYNNQTPAKLNNLQAIREVDDQRARSAATQAAQDQAALRAHREELATAVDQENLPLVEQLLAEQPTPRAIRSYEELRVAEQEAVTRYEEILSEQDTIDALLSITNSTEQTRLAMRLRAASNAHEAFTTQPPQASREAFTTLQNTTEQLLQEHNATTHQTAQALAQVNYQERTMACTLKNTSCPQPPSTPTTFAQAVDNWRSACEELSALNETFAQAQSSYEQRIRPNTSSQAIQQEIAATRNSTSYNQTQLLQAARNATLATNNQTERLAAQLTTSNQTTQLVQAHCPVLNRTAQLPNTSLQASLPEANNATTPYQPINFSEPTCCNHLTCGSCEQPRQAILFVHGHAFAQSTPPESSLQSFERLAQALQEDAGIYYAGRIYAQENTPAHQKIRGPVSLSTTYYYNSYAQQGESLRVAQKDYNLETFALRLREAIDATRQATGAQEVTIIAHSMGGLVTRSYLDIFGDEQIDKIVMLGTPNQGITGRTARICPLIGSARSCEDMRAGSIFLQGLPASTGVETLTIAGVGCEEREYDGVIEASSVELPEARNEQVNGTCVGTEQVLHTDLLRPDKHPEVLKLIQDFITT